MANPGASKFGRGLRLAGVALLAASTAYAADLPLAPPPPPAPQPLPTWAGIYAGTFLGAGFSSVRLSQTTSHTHSISGATGGGLIGYNWQTGRFVYGLEGDLALNQIRGDDAGGAGLVPTRDDTLYSARLRGRLGYDFGDFLPFVAGGVAMSELYVASRTGNNIGQTHQEAGWTIGAGLDWKVRAPILGPVILRAEYVYEAYPSKAFDVGAATPVRAKFSTNMVRVALISYGGDGSSWRPALQPGAVDWSGAYGGFIGGYGWTRAKTTSPAFGSTSVSAAGPVGGIYVGRNFAFGPWVVGLEGATELRDVTGTGPLPDGTRVRYRGNIEADTELRAGYAFGPFLPFIAAGAMFNRSVQRNLDTGAFVGRGPSDDWTVGGGLDYRVADRWSVRGEYLFASSFKKTASVLCAGCRQSEHSQLLRFGVAYHFE